MAVPPSTMYRFRKFARRNLAIITSLGAAAAVLILATTFSTWLALRAVTAEREQSRLLGITEKALASEAAQSEAAQEHPSFSRDPEKFARAPI